MKNFPFAFLVIILGTLMIIGVVAWTASQYKPEYPKTVKEHVFISPGIPLNAPIPLTDAEDKVHYACLMLSHKESFKSNKELVKKCDELGVRWQFYHNIRTDNRVLKLIIDMANLDKQGPQ